MRKVKQHKTLLTALLIALACHSIIASGQTVNIYGLRDINLHNIRSQQGVRNAQSVCTYSDINGHGYSITARGSGNNGEFSLSASGTKDILYSVEWSDKPGQQHGATLNAGAPLGMQNTINNKSACTANAMNSSSLIIAISPQDLASAMANVNYSGTLSLIIAPQ